jgi:hypothetical protein
MPSYCFNLATSPSEVSGYFALRHSIFVDEQQLFQGSDVDTLDAIAYPIVALAAVETAEAQRHRESGRLILPLTHHPVLLNHHAHPTQNSSVLGVVRIYEPEPGGYLDILLVQESQRSL